MRRCSGSETNLLVLTTREHILQQAASWYEELESAGLPLRRFLLQLSAYSKYDRARIFYNHIWHSHTLSLAARKALIENRSYLKIVNHSNYNPRLIEHITGVSAPLDSEAQADYVNFAVSTLDRPHKIWQRAFDRQLTDYCRTLLWR